MVDTCVAWCSPVLINAPSIINAASAIRTRKMVSALISLFFSSLFSKLFLLEFDWLKRLMYKQCLEKERIKDYTPEWRGFSR